MKVTIQTLHFKADRKLEEFIHTKMDKLSSLFDGVIGSDVTLRLENAGDNKNKIAEIKLLVPGQDLFAKKQSRTFEEATDNAVEALRRQLNKHKEKLRSK